ncbi:exodeoxyribonuclease VII large subunit [Haematospirillum jordaniae]|uniref:exodeoxyribonuclease VII large subunit n=1 Tax=Haematospirillum jordaniae TaxID=1549855 RepID=UPI0014328ABF|nr:exodeoxyribonuclease VII large subunit [Haematospirillum jordaniae]NKD85423.1 exodeoxyribonuclease VII large subunit [Haematospirillum jordaniae]
MTATETTGQADPVHNLPERTVSEVSTDLKRMVEDRFARVRVRGEISQPKLAGSGHCYLRLKDDNAVLDGVIWKGTYPKLGTKPQDGLEVIVTGRLTTWPGRSSYQIVIESLELAGEGALLKLLEERRRRLAAEGLFDPATKKALPFLPRVIGVVTSPTGAVIRDILHRLSDRFPVHVLVWPVLVQGEGAAAQIAAAVRGFNALGSDSPVVRPDLVIVARGGGSLEDLMAFNEEEVVRAVAASDIPVISAVGHETDTTLCDFAADRRAPTPTGAAEIAVPVRLDLCVQVADVARRLTAATRRSFAEQGTRLQGLARGLPPLDRLVQGHVQRLEDRAERLGTAVGSFLERNRSSFLALAAALRHPRDRVAMAFARLDTAGSALSGAFRLSLGGASTRLGSSAVRLAAVSPVRGLAQGRDRVTGLEQRLVAAMSRLQQDEGQRLLNAAERLEAASWQRALQRGYAVVRDSNGLLVDRRASVRVGDVLSIQLADGDLPVVARGPGGRVSRRTRQDSDPRQDSLF